MSWDGSADGCSLMASGKSKRENAKPVRYGRAGSDEMRDPEELGKNSTFSERRSL